MDIWHRALGLRQQIKYISSTAIPVKTPIKIYKKCALVRNQPNTSLRPTHSVCSLRSASLYPQTSISTESPSQPPRGTFTPHNTHQKTEKTLDIWCDELRCGQWTKTWSNDTTNSALAYREFCTVFSDCKYSITYSMEQSPSWEAKQWTLQLVKKFPAFMEPESPSPYPQVSATCPYPEPTASSFHDPLQHPEDPS
jgi:hypothetical protein